MAGTRRRAFWCAAAFGAVVIACRREPAPIDSRAPQATLAPQPSARSADRAVAALPDAAPAAPSAPVIVPLPEQETFVDLPVEGFGAAVVSIPSGAREPRPVVVALHGNFDRPEWQCQVWRGIIERRAFVLCPRGVPRNDVPKHLDRWEYAGDKKTAAELDAALLALAARYPDHVAQGPVVFTGFSLGAILGTRIVQRQADKYPRVVLIEGGEKGWSSATARQFAEKGGLKVLFVCAQGGCKHKAAGPVRALEKAGVGARVAYAGNLGHTYDGKVAETVAAEWPWLVEGDQRFTGLPAE